MQYSKIIHQYFGKWWLPNKQKDTIVGNFIIYENGNYKLEALDFFECMDASKIYNNGDLIEMIRGVALDIDNQKVFSFHLLHNHLVGISRSSLTRFRISNSFYLISRSQAEVKLLMFDSCFLKPLNLQNWLNEGQTDIKSVSEQEYDIKFKRKSPQILQDTETFTLGIYYGYNMQYPYQKGFNIESIPSIGVKFKRPTSLIEIRKIIDSINWLMTLIFFSPTYLKEINFVVNHQSEENDYFEFKFYDKLIDESYKEIPRHQMLISKEDLFSKPGMIQNWLDFHSRNKYFVRNYIANFRNSNQFSDTEFLNLVLGIITFSEKNYRIQGRTAFKSLKEVDQKLSNCYESFMVLDDLFFKKVEATRHYYVHESENNSDFLIEGDEELFKYILRLKFLATAILLKSIGFTPKEIDERLSRRAIGWIAFESKSI